MKDFERRPFELDTQQEREEKPGSHLLSGFVRDPQDDVDWAEQQDPEGEAAERKKDLRIVIVWAVIVMALLVGIILYLQLRKTRVSLNEYVQIETTGYESIGEAAYRFDTDAFVRDYKEVLRYRGGKANTRVGDYANAAEALVKTCVKGSLTKDTELSNGDMVTFAWDCDEAQAAADYHCVLIYANIDLTVEDLEEPALFDPFAGITVDFSGIAPDGTAAIRRLSEDDLYHDLSFTLTQTDHLRNGDTVKVKVALPDGGDVADQTLRAYGKVPSTLEKTYTVSGLTTYARRLEDIPQDTLQAMQLKAEEVFQEREIPNWQTGAELVRREYLGSYLLTAEESTAGYAEEADNSLIQEIAENLLPAGVGTVQQTLLPGQRAPFGLPFGWGSQGSEEEDTEEDAGFHWSDLLDPSFYGIGSGDSSGNGGSHSTTPTPTPEPEEENWSGLEDILHTADYEDDRQNILYLVYRVEVSLRGGSVFHYYTYTAFSDIRILGDGSADVDLELWHVPTGSSFFGVTSGDVVGVRQGLRTYYFSGFENLNDLYRRCIYAQRTAYTYETDVEE